MSLETKALALATAVGVDIKNLLDTVGSLTSLTTTNKDSLVHAINELYTSLQAVQDLEATNNIVIDDAAGAGVTDKTWSADKLIMALEQTRNELLAGAPSAFDTLKEVADYLATNDQNVSDLISALTGTVRYDAAQTLLTTEQQQACANIGVGANDVLVRDIYLIARDTNTYIDPGYVEPGYVA